MNPQELRIGNYFVAAHESNMPIMQIKSFYQNGVHTGLGKIYNFNLLLAIILNEDWLIKCRVKELTLHGRTWSGRFINAPNANVFNYELPEWIKSVHELQNWYYWKFNKTELKIK